MVFKKEIKPEVKKEVKKEEVVKKEPKQGEDLDWIKPVPEVKRDNPNDG